MGTFIPAGLWNEQFVLMFGSQSSYWTLPDIIVGRVTFCRKIGDIMNVLERRFLHNGLICTVLQTLPSFAFIQLYYDIIETQRENSIKNFAPFDHCISSKL